MKGKIIAIANQKGGVGKTTTAINFASALAVLEYRVLLVDVDPQGNASTGLGVGTDNGTIYDVFSGDKTMHDIITQTDQDHLSVAPADIDLVGAEIELVDANNREFLLKNVLDPLKPSYDFIILDCQPSLGIITVNALTAADSVLIPIQAEVFALQGLSKLSETIEIIKEGLNPNLKVEGILLSMFDKRLVMSNMVVDEIRKSSDYNVYETKIHRNIKVAEAPITGQSVIHYDVKSKGAQDFINLATEFISKQN